MLINEVKAISIRVGDTFTLSGDLGKFKKGEEINIDNVQQSAMDFIVTVSNKTGDTDTFYLDRDDEI
jgi:predicted PolB exonuclease-like 3'-5' exonuclease